jgi:molybdopterin-guanine dinucleotide biosynthesis protein
MPQSGPYPRHGHHHFLGSGKTTLIARLFQRTLTVDPAVIVNKFSKVGLDHGLVETVEGGEVGVTEIAAAARTPEQGARDHADRRLAAARPRQAGEREAA